MFCGLAVCQSDRSIGVMLRVLDSTTTNFISPCSHRNILQSYLILELGAWLPEISKRVKKGR